MPRPKKFAKEYNKKTKEKATTEAFLKTKEGGYLITDVVDKIKKQGGSPSEITEEKTFNKIREILGGGAELRGGGRAVMKKGGKV